jgi:uncharacterized protein YrrD
MQKINELFGKQVISQQTGNQLATVRDVVLDAESRQIVALILTSGRSRHDQVARMAQIHGMGEFVVVDETTPLLSSDDDSEVVALRENAEQITGKKLISVAGEQFGTVGDMYVGRNGTIIGFELKQGMFSSSDPQVVRATDVQAIGKDAVIVKTNQPVALSLLTEEETATTEPVQVPPPISADEYTNEFNSSSSNTPRD